MRDTYEKWREAMLEVQRVTERNAELELRVSDLENERSDLSTARLLIVAMVTRDELMYESSAAKLGVIKLSKEIEEKKEESLVASQRTEELQQKMSDSSTSPPFSVSSLCSLLSAISPSRLVALLLLLHSLSFSLSSPSPSLS
jgi:hypothetical protein